MTPSGSLPELGAEEPPDLSQQLGDSPDSTSLTPSRPCRRAGSDKRLTGTPPADAADGTTPVSHGTASSRPAFGVESQGSPLPASELDGSDRVIPGSLVTPLATPNPKRWNSRRDSHPPSHLPPSHLPPSHLPPISDAPAAPFPDWSSSLETPPRPFLLDQDQVMTYLRTGHGAPASPSTRTGHPAKADATPGSLSPLQAMASAAPFPDTRIVTAPTDSDPYAALSPARLTPPELRPHPLPAGLGTTPRLQRSSRRHDSARVSHFARHTKTMGAHVHVPVINATTPVMRQEKRGRRPLLAEASMPLAPAASTPTRQTNPAALSHMFQASARVIAPLHSASYAEPPNMPTIPEKSDTLDFSVLAKRLRMRAQPIKRSPSPAPAPLETMLGDARGHPSRSSSLSPISDMSEETEEELQAELAQSSQVSSQASTSSSPASSLAVGSQGLVGKDHEVETPLRPSVDLETSSETRNQPIPFQSRLNIVRDQNLTDSRDWGETESLYLSQGLQSQDMDVTTALASSTSSESDLPSLQPEPHSETQIQTSVSLRPSEESECLGTVSPPVVADDTRLEITILDEPDLGSASTAPPSLVDQTKGLPQSDPSFLADHHYAPMGRLRPPSPVPVLPALHSSPSRKDGRHSPGRTVSLDAVRPYERESVLAISSPVSASHTESRESLPFHMAPAGLIGSPTLPVQSAPPAMDVPSTVSFSDPMAALAPVAPSHPEASSKPHSISLTDHPDSSLSRTPTAPVATEDEMATPRGGLTDHSSPEMPLIRSQSNHEYHTAPDEGATHHASLSEMPLRRSAGESQDTRLQESDVFAPVLPHQTAELPRPDVINSLPLSSASNPLTTVGLPTSGRAANNETIAETSVSGPALGPPSDNEVDLKQGRADDSTTPSMSSSPPQEQPAVDTEVPRAPTELTSDKSLVSEVDEAGQHPPPVETDDTSVRGEVSRPDMQDTWIADALASEVSADPPVHGDGKARLSDSTALEESSVPAREARRSPEAELPVDMSPAVAATTLNQNGKRSGSTISSEALDVFKKSRVTSEKCETSATMSLFTTATGKHIAPPTADAQRRAALLISAAAVSDVSDGRQASSAFNDPSVSAGQAGPTHADQPGYQNEVARQVEPTLPYQTTDSDVLSVQKPPMAPRPKTLAGTLFTTASGRPLAPPSATARRRAEALIHETGNTASDSSPSVSGFTMGSDKAMASASTESSQRVTTLIADGQVPPSRDGSAPTSLFATASGKTMPMPSSKALNHAARVIASDVSNKAPPSLPPPSASTSLFTTASGKVMRPPSKEATLRASALIDGSGDPKPDHKTAERPNRLTTAGNKAIAPPSADAQARAEAILGSLSTTDVAPTASASRNAFSTASGKQMAPPSAEAQRKAQTLIADSSVTPKSASTYPTPVTPGLSLFSTASGKQLASPSADAQHRAAALMRDIATGTSSTSHGPHSAPGGQDTTSPSTTRASLFSTASGKAMAPPSAKARNRAAFLLDDQQRTLAPPASGSSLGISLFQTAGGKSMIPPSRDAQEKARLIFDANHQPEQLPSHNQHYNAEHPSHCTDHIVTPFASPLVRRVSGSSNASASSPMQKGGLGIVASATRSPYTSHAAMITRFGARGPDLGRGMSKRPRTLHPKLLRTGAAILSKQAEAKSVPVKRELKVFRFPTTEQEDNRCPFSRVLLSAPQSMHSTGPYDVSRFTWLQFPSEDSPRLRSATIYAAHDRAFHGVEDARKGLLELGASENLADMAWICNHWTLILWKLCGTLARGMVSVDPPFAAYEEVFRQLRLRYQREMELTQRPALRLVLERDNVPNRFMVLVVLRTPSPSALQTLREGCHVVLSDGWYCVQAVMDTALTDCLRSGRIRIGTKLAMSGIQLSGSADGVNPLAQDLEIDPFVSVENEVQSVSLQLNVNSVRLARPDALLGYQSSVAYISALQTVTPEGGPVAAIDVIVLRRYPVMTVENLDGPQNNDRTAMGGRRNVITRNARDEAHAQRLWQTRFNSRVEFHLQRLTQDAERDKLPQTEQTRRELIDEARLAAEEDVPARVLSTYLRICVADFPGEAYSRADTRIALLTVYNPHPDHVSACQEGRRMVIFGVRPARSQVHAMQLSGLGTLPVMSWASCNLIASKPFQYISHPAQPDALTRTWYRPRCIMPFARIMKAVPPGTLAFVDAAGLVIRVSNVSAGHDLGTSQITLLLLDAQCNWAELRVAGHSLPHITAGDHVRLTDARVISSRSETRLLRTAAETHFAVLSKPCFGTLARQRRVLELCTKLQDEGTGIDAISAALQHTFGTSLMDTAAGPIAAVSRPGSLRSKARLPIPPPPPRPATPSPDDAGPHELPVFHIDVASSEPLDATFCVAISQMCCYLVQKTSSMTAVADAYDTTLFEGLDCGPPLYHYVVSENGVVIPNSTGVATLPDTRFHVLPLSVGGRWLWTIFPRSLFPADASECRNGFRQITATRMTWGKHVMWSVRSAVLHPGMERLCSGFSIEWHGLAPRDDRPQRSAQTEQAPLLDPAGPERHEHLAWRDDDEFIAPASQALQKIVVGSTDPWLWRDGQLGRRDRSVALRPLPSHLGGYHRGPLLLPVLTSAPVPTLAPAPAPVSPATPPAVPVVVRAPP